MVSNKKALICGISGQDGSYMAKLLLNKGYNVFGGTRENKLSKFDNLKNMGIYSDIEFHQISLTDFRSIIIAIDKIKPDEIYNLSAQSSVAISFNNTIETFDSIVTANLNLLEAIKFLNPSIKFYNASSSECFGKVKSLSATEETSFNPVNPYGVAKTTSFWNLSLYRKIHNLFACSGILFNHESPYRSETFVTRKITKAAVAIKFGLQDKLSLGNIDVKRDWGFAGDYVDAMWKILQYHTADDYIISSNEIHSVREFIEKAFSNLEINIVWKGNGTEEVGIDSKTNKEIIKIDPKFFRPTEVDLILGDSSKIRKTLGWSPKTSFDELVNMMINHDMKLLSKN